MYAAILGTSILLPVQMTERTVQTDFLACNPERQFIRAEQLRESGNARALQEFTAGALLSGTCVSLKKGDSVLITGSGRGLGIVRVRPKGSFKIFFTSENAFE
jgi:hypothetical protein